MEFESPDVEKEFPGLYASESGKRSNESDFSDDAHERPSKKDLLIGKRKDKKDSKKDRGYAALGGESSPEEDPDTKSPSKSKKSKSFKFPSSIKKEKREKSREKDGKEKEREADKEKKKDKEGKAKLKLKDRKKSKHGSEEIVEIGDEQPVFGVPLLLAVTRSRCHDGVDIPLVVRDAIDYVQEHGLTMEGVYKISGVKSKVQHLRRLYNQREPAQASDLDVTTATSVLKQFLRELPAPLLTNELLARFEEAAASKDVLVRENQLSSAVSQLPECNRQLLAWLVVHLDSVTTHEKQNKMNAQNMAITLSPVLQMSHRLFTALLCHSRFLFPGVSLNKYVPPLTSASPWMPDTEAAIADELRKQESLLNQTHQEMNAGFVSKRKEEQLWEVQRIITQLKRKLRTFQRCREMSVNQKSLDEERSRPAADEEFRMDLTLQKAHSVSEEDAPLALVPVPASLPLAPILAPPPRPANDVSPLTPLAKPTNEVPALIRSTNEVPALIRSTNEVPALTRSTNEVPALTRSTNEVSPMTPSDSLGAELGTLTPPTSNEPSTSLLVEEVDGGRGDGISASLDGSMEGVDRIEPDEELQGLLQEETLLQLEQEELLNLQADLQGRVLGERAEIERLRAALALARANYNYRGFGCDSSDGSSSPSLSDGSETEDPEVEERFLELQRENLQLQEKKAALVRRIMEEREACLHLRVQVSLMQLSRETKQHA